MKRTTQFNLIIVLVVFVLSGMMILTIDGYERYQRVKAGLEVEKMVTIPMYKNLQFSEFTTGASSFNLTQCVGGTTMLTIFLLTIIFVRIKYDHALRD